MHLLTLSLLLMACGPKKAPETAATAPVEAAPAPPPAPEPEPEPEPPPEVTNANFNATVVRADGTSAGGHVKRVERSVDFFADEGWTTEANKLKLSLEADGGNKAKDATWDQIKSISVAVGKIPGDVDCSYDSNFTPWMYDCTVKTTATVVLKDGTTWTVAQRHKWKLTFDDGSSAEFWLWKYPARQQDDKVVDLETTNPENIDLYTSLQDRLKSEVKTTLVTKVNVQ